MRVHGLHHVSVVIRDTARSLHFYHELLGLAIIERRELGFPGAWLEVGGKQIHLLEVSNCDPVDGRPTHVGRDRHIALIVDDIEEFAQRLERARIDFTRSRSGRKALFCRDPDGNGIELIQAPE